MHLRLITLTATVTITKTYTLPADRTDNPEEFVNNDLDHVAKYGWDVKEIKVEEESAD